MFDHVELLGLFHARKLRAARAGAASSAGTPCTSDWASPSAFYDRFTPAIATSDFALRAAALDSALDFVAVCRR